MRQAAQGWTAQLRGIERPWLCWCVSPRWCLVQQRLIQEVGWTPVIGWDTNITTPVLLAGSVAVDFNAALQMPRAFLYFFLEWIFLMGVDRLAFWHVDLLLSQRDMARAAHCFAALQPGQIALPWNRSNRVLRTLAPYRRVQNENRLFEVVGCVTADASRQQYAEGLGFWRHVECHPHASVPPGWAINTGPRANWEHSVGLTLWAKRHPAQHVLPGVDMKTGHATQWKLPGVTAATPKAATLDTPGVLEQYARAVGLRL
jgi:hypothetical protein